MLVLSDVDNKLASIIGAEEFFHVDDWSEWITNDWLHGFACKITKDVWAIPGTPYHLYDCRLPGRNNYGFEIFEVVQDDDREDEIGLGSVNRCGELRNLLVRLLGLV